jgi:hypothetical protein
LAAITEKTLKKNERFGVFNRPAVGWSPAAAAGTAADGAARQRPSIAYPPTMVGTITIETRGA